MAEFVRLFWKANLSRPSAVSGNFSSAWENVVLRPFCWPNVGLTLDGGFAAGRQSPPGGNRLFPTEDRRASHPTMMRSTLVYVYVGRLPSLVPLSFLW